jgi:hypothetical protein
MILRHECDRNLRFGVRWDSPTKSSIPKIRLGFKEFPCDARIVALVWEFEALADVRALNTALSATS